MRATLTYHAVDDSRSPIAVTPAAFDAHVRWLTSGRVQVLDLDRLQAHPDTGPDAVALTFDDGFRGVREPIRRLRALGLPVTLFVVTGRVGTTNAWNGRDDPHVPTLPLMDWADLDRLAAEGVTFGAHTRRHQPLSQCSPEQQDDELAGCQADLASRFGANVEHFAYPYGDVDDAVASRVARVYRYGHTTEFRARRTSDVPMRLPRLDMFYFQAPGALESWGSARFAARLAWGGARRLARSLLLGGPFPHAPRRWTR
jgi:peptidoglycan/xylan/chitin deacetylase (PgdA/CDA1 family)